MGIPIIPQHSEREWALVVTYKEAAYLLGEVSVRHIERLVAAKKLRRIGKGRARRITYRSILVYIERESNG